MSELVKPRNVVRLNYFYVPWAFSASRPRVTPFIHTISLGRWFAAFSYLSCFRYAPWKLRFPMNFSFLFLIPSISVHLVSIFFKTFFITCSLRPSVGRLSSIRCHMRGPILHSNPTLFSLFLVKRFQLEYHNVLPKIAMWRRYLLDRER